MRGRLTYAIKCINESVFDEESSSQDVRQRRAFGKYQHYCGSERKGSVEDCESGCLWYVGQNEHSCCYADGCGEGWCEARPHWPPEIFVGYEIVDSL